MPLLVQILGTSQVAQGTHLVYLLIGLVTNASYV